MDKDTGEGSQIFFFFPLKKKQTNRKKTDTEQLEKSEKNKNVALFEIRTAEQSEQKQPMSRQSRPHSLIHSLTHSNTVVLLVPVGARMNV